MDAGKGVLFHDPRGLQALKREAVQDPSAAIRPVAKQFESVFLQMMLKSMRAATPEGGLFNDDATRAYRDMLDNQMAVDLAGQGGIGMADMMVRQLAPTVRAGDAPADAAARPQAQALQLSLRQSAGKEET